MTTTAFDDQFVAGTQTIERIHEPSSRESILRRNIAALEVALRTQTERAEAAEVELAKAREQEPVGFVSEACLEGVLDGTRYNISLFSEDIWTNPVYARPVPAPAVPTGCAIISRTLTPEAWKRLCNADIWPVTPKSFQRMLDVLMEVALLQSAEVTNEAADRLLEGGV
jgi:hypothetical protein